MRIVEISSFVAVPLAGMTLAQLGADVVRIDPVGGAADYRRWPLADSGASIYWAGLNKGKRSMEIDVGSDQGRELATRLIVAAGVLITNVAGRRWHSDETLRALRPDLIHLEVVGRADGSTAVDYTVNAGTGFPLVTGPAEQTGPVNHVLPSWDVSCGLYAALAIVAALRHRDASGSGASLRLPLDDVALATAANLGFLTEAMLGGPPRPRLGNAIFGQYGRDFATSDGASFMVVALTARHFRDLTRLTATTEEVAALAAGLGADFGDEGRRYEHRDALNAIFARWFATHTAAEAAAALAASSVLWERYQSFTEVVNSPRVKANPLFTTLEQDQIGSYLAPGLPVSVDGVHAPAATAPVLGDGNTSVPSEWLGE